MTPTLTEAQRLILSRLRADGAFPSALGNGSVFLYRGTDGGTDRWLVSPAGRIVEFERLANPRVAEHS